MAAPYRTATSVPETPNLASGGDHDGSVQMAQSGATANGLTVTQEERGTKAESASRAVLNRVSMPRLGRAAMPFGGSYKAYSFGCALVWLIVLAIAAGTDVSERRTSQLTCAGW